MSYVQNECKTLLHFNNDIFIDATSIFILGQDVNVSDIIKTIYDSLKILKFKIIEFIEVMDLSIICSLGSINNHCYLLQFLKKITF